MTYPPQGPYGQQPDPYGQQQPDQYGGGYQQPSGQYGGGYDPNAQYGGGGVQYGGLGGPPPKKNMGPIIAVVAIVVLLLGGLGITGFVAPGFFLADDKKSDTGGGGGGSSSSKKADDSGIDAFADKLVAAADEQDKSALKALTCEDADSIVESATDAIDETSGAKLSDTKKESDDEYTIVITITHDGEDDEYEATAKKDGGDWCWQDFAGEGMNDPSGGGSTSEEPTDDTATSSPPSGGGGGGDSDGEEFVQSFLDKLNAGDSAGAVALLCPDSTSQSDVSEAAGKSPSLQMDPSGTQADSTYVGADLTGSMDGTDITSARTSAFLEDAGWCIYTFYAY